MHPLDYAMDVDSHEMVPSHLWGREFGPHSAAIADALHKRLEMSNNDFLSPDVKEDDTPITGDTVWDIRGVRAPASFDCSRRIAAMNQMGIGRQLIFPSCGAFAVAMREKFGATALGSIAEYNAWASRVGRIDARLRPVGILVPDGTVDHLIRDTKALIATGIRAVMLPIAAPPCGMSPAAPDFDPFWDLLSRENVTLTAHIGERDFFHHEETWAKGSAVLEAAKSNSLEVGHSPYNLSVIHYKALNFLTVMVMGGVFERHPALRCGIIEFGASWLGGLADNLDIWSDVFKRRTKDVLKMTPSRYLAQNVRVTPFHFEPITDYLAKYPALADCYCYSTDYPHVEGGTRSKETVLRKVEPFGSDMIEKIFVRNGEFLLPA